MMWNMKERICGSLVVIFALMKIVVASENYDQVFDIVHDSGLCVPQSSCPSHEYNVTENSVTENKIASNCSAIMVCDGNAVNDYVIKNASAIIAPDQSPLGCRTASFSKNEAVFVADSSEFYSQVGNDDVGAIVLIDHVEIILGDQPVTIDKLGYPMISRPLAILGACVDPPKDGNDFSLKLRHGMCIIDGKNISNLFDVSNDITASLTLYNVRLQNAHIPARVNGVVNLSYGGSALQMSDGGAAYLLQVDFVQNTAPWSGAVLISGRNSETKFVCVRCRFQENYSVTVGAGCVHLQKRVQAIFVETSFDRCVAGNNYTLPDQAGAWGGAVNLFGKDDNEGLSAYFKHCLFSNNTQYGAGQVDTTLIAGYHNAYEKIVDVFSFCKDCHIVLDSGYDEDYASHTPIDPTKTRKIPIWGGNPNSIVNSSDGFTSPQLRAWYLPSLLSYGSPISSTVLEKGIELQESGTQNLTSAINEFKKCNGKDQLKKSDYSDFMETLFISKIFPGDIHDVTYKGKHCQNLPERENMASDEGCSLNFTIESTLYEEFSMDPSEPTQFDFVDLKPESSKSKIQKLVIILSVTFSSLVVAILLAVFFLKKKPGKGKRLDLEIPLISSSFKSGSESDTKKSPHPEQTFMNKIKDVLIPNEQIERKESLGRGAQGEVYIGLWDTTVVALKRQLLQHMIHEEVMMNKNIEREVVMMKELRHPHVVQFFGLSVSGPYIYIVMEYMAKRSLRELLKKQDGSLDSKRLLRIAYQVSAGMQHLHQSGILHRDLTPGNIFISKDYDAKVGDFGMSRRVNGLDSSAITLVGTPGYMAPEVYQGISYSYAADVWSFGSLLHHLITGKHYYEEYSNPYQILTAISQRKELPRIKCEVEGWSPALLELVGKCCDADPKSRPSFETIRTVLLSELEAVSGETWNPTEKLSSSLA